MSVLYPSLNWYRLLLLIPNPHHYSLVHSIYPIASFECILIHCFVVSICYTIVGFHSQLYLSVRSELLHEPLILKLLRRDIHYRRDILQQRLRQVAAIITVVIIANLLLLSVRIIHCADWVVEAAQWG